MFLFVSFYLGSLRPQSFFRNEGGVGLPEGVAERRSREQSRSEREKRRDPSSRVRVRLSNVQVGGGVEEEVQDLQDLI